MTLKMESIYSRRSESRIRKKIAVASLDICLVQLSYIYDIIRSFRARSQRAKVFRSGILKKLHTYNNWRDSVLFFRSDFFIQKRVTFLLLVIKSSKGQYSFTSLKKLEQSHCFHFKPYGPVFQIREIFYYKFVFSSEPDGRRRAHCSELEKNL